MDEQNPKPSPSARRPYVKPELRSVELFERRSLACGTVPSASPRSGCGTHQSVV